MKPFKVLNDTKVNLNHDLYTKKKKKIWTLLLPKPLMFYKRTHFIVMPAKHSNI